MQAGQVQAVGNIVMGLGSERRSLNGGRCHGIVPTCHMPAFETSDSTSHCVGGQDKDNIMLVIYKPESSGGLFLMYHYTVIFVTKMKPEMYWEEIWCMYACQAVMSTLISDLHAVLSIP